MEVTDGTPDRFIDIWLDLEKSFLVLKAIHYYRKSARISKRYGALEKERVLDQDGIEYVPWYEYLSFETRRVLSGLWLTTHGVFRYPAFPSMDDMHMHLDINRVELNSPVDRSMFNVEPKLETFISDKRTGIEEYNLPSTVDKLPTNHERLLEEALEVIAAEDNIALADKPREPQPVYVVSCGPMALYALSRLNTKHLTLDQIHSLSSANPSGYSLQALSESAASCSWTLKPVKVTDGHRHFIQGNFIAHVRAVHEGEENTTNHFVVARYQGDKVRTLSAPTINTLSLEEFERIWTGYALLDERQVEALKAPVASARFTATLIGGCVLIISIATLFWRRACKLTPSLVLLGLMTGCDRGADSSQANQHKSFLHDLVIEGPSTVDLGVMNEGDKRRASFQLRNASVRTLRLGTAKSCGCTQPVLSMTDLPPGKSCSMKVGVDSAGRGGSLNEYVDIKDGQNRLATVWVIGEVIPRLRLQVEPSSVDVGIRTVGSPLSLPATINTYVKHPDFTHELILPESHSSQHGCQMSWSSEAQFVVRDGGSRGSTRSAVLSVDISKPIEFNGVPIMIAAKGPEGKIVAMTKIMVFGRVVSAFEVIPDVCFLGRIKPRETIRCSFTIRSVKTLSGAPRVTGGPNVKRMDIQEIPGGVDVTIDVSSEQQQGVFRDSLNIEWGDAKAAVPIVGRM